MVYYSEACFKSSSLKKSIVFKMIINPNLTFKRWIGNIQLHNELLLIISSVFSLKKSSNLLNLSKQLFGNYDVLCYFAVIFAARFVPALSECQFFLLSFLFCLNVLIYFVFVYMLVFFKSMNALFLRQSHVKEILITNTIYDQTRTAAVNLEIHCTPNQK